MIKALILDLDDTIFETRTIGIDLIQPFLDALDRTNTVLSPEKMREAKRAMYKKPFKEVARLYGFTQVMVDETLLVLETLPLNFDIQPYEDYPVILELEQVKFW